MARSRVSASSRGSYSVFAILAGSGLTGAGTGTCNAGSTSSNHNESEYIAADLLTDSTRRPRRRAALVSSRRQQPSQRRSVCKSPGMGTPSTGGRRTERCPWHAGSAFASRPDKAGSFRSGARIKSSRTLVAGPHLQMRSTYLLTSGAGERVQPARAVAERFDVHAERVQNREVQVGDRCAERMPDESAGLDSDLLPSNHRDRQVVVEMRVAVADARPVEQQRVVQHRALAFRRRGQPGHQMRKLLEMVLIHLVQAFELGLLVLVMRQRVV